MPAAKQSQKDEGQMAEVEVLRAQLQDALERLEEKEQQPERSEIGQLVEMLASRMNAPQPAREAALVGSAAGILQEADGALEALPEPERRLPYPKVYRSRGKGFTIIKKARRAAIDAEGNQWIQPGLSLLFAPNGEFKTEDADLAAWLESRPSFGNEFWDAEHPPEGSPDPAVAFERITQMTVDLDLEGLSAMQQEERAGLNRRDIMTALSTAYSQVEIYRSKQQAAGQQA